MPAFDATAEANTGAIAATSLTFSHTCTGSGLMLIVGVCSSAAPTNVTYAGVPMVQISPSFSNSTAFNSMWYLAAPTTGANNVVISTAASQTILGGSISVTGASQTQPVNHVDIKQTSTVITSTISPTQNNCILVDNCAFALNTAPTAGGSTQEVSQSSSIGFGQGMSQTVLTGDPATTITWTPSGSAAAAYRIIAIAAPILNVPKPNYLRPHIFSPGLAR